jgi:hypothetical protein
MPNMILDESQGAEGSEDCVVLLWRREQFIQLGFDAADAQVLAESPADLGEARRLSRAGCPVTLAFRILA